MGRVNGLVNGVAGLEISQPVHLQEAVEFLEFPQRGAAAERRRPEPTESGLIDL